MPKKGHEIATIDVVMVTVKPEKEAGETSEELGLTTANKIQVDPQIETNDAIKLIIKGVLVAQKRESSTLTGNTLVLTDNVFNPELVMILQGGTIVLDDDGNITKYTPPVAGEKIDLKPFELCAYSAQYDASGLIVQYEKITYPNCTGQPISMSSEDNVFRVPSYTIISAPAEGEPPYTIEYVKTLPTLTEAE